MHIMIHSSFVLVSFSSDGSTTTGTLVPYHQQQQVPVPGRYQQQVFTPQQAGGTTTNYSSTTRVGFDIRHVEHVFHTSFMNSIKISGKCHDNCKMAFIGTGTSS